MNKTSTSVSTTNWATWTERGREKKGGEAGVCGGIVGGRESFVRYAFFTIKKCTSN